MDYKPKYFKPYELLPRKIYAELLAKGWPEERMWQLFDSRTLYVNDKIRERYGKMIANTYHWGGEHQFRGFRPRWCTLGAEWSQHRFARASDLVPVQVAVEEIWADIELGINYDLITCIEKSSLIHKITWLHHDERNYNGLLIVYP